VLSGTIEYQGLVPGELLEPLVHFGWILSYGSWNLFAASPPVSMRAHIYDDRIRAAQPRFDLIDRNPGYISGVVCNQNRCLADNQEKNEISSNGPSHKPRPF
jgi:hypothetical protein